MSWLHSAAEMSDIKAAIGDVLMHLSVRQKSSFAKELCETSTEYVRSEMCEMLS